MYEITFITREENDPIVKKTIEKLNGKILHEERLGRKKFAYPINKDDAGFYTSYYFEIDGEKLNELSKTLRLDTDIIRYLVISRKTIVQKQVKPETREVKTPKSLEKTIEEKAEPVIEASVETKEVENEVKAEKPKTKSQTPKEVKAEKPKEEKTAKKTGTKKEVEKEVKAEKPAIEKNEIPEVKPVQKQKEEKKEDLGDEERLKALEEKLEEILKD
jgi:small subunit ribosomal protein S6